jgi:hypothetical protein
VKAHPRMPTVGAHRGVAIHGFQPVERIEVVVRPEIDRVYAMSAPVDLAKFAADASNCPEARLFAAARVEACWQLAAEGRAIRPPVDLEKLRAATAGLDDLHWCDPRRYGALFDFRGSVPREVPLTDAQLRG